MTGLFHATVNGIQANHPGMQTVYSAGCDELRNAYNMAMMTTALCCTLKLPSAISMFVCNIKILILKIRPSLAALKMEANVPSKGLLGPG